MADVDEDDDDLQAALALSMGGAGASAATATVVVAGVHTGTEVGVGGSGGGAGAAGTADGPVTYLKCIWSGKPYQLCLPLAATVGDVKTALFAQTNVRQDRQKLAGFRLAKAGGALDDSTPLSSLKLKCKGEKKPHKFRMMGTAEAAIAASQAAAADAKRDVVIFDDLELDYFPTQAELENDLAAQRMLGEKCASTQINIIHAPRPGKKLLVLDLDHTLLDFSSKHQGNMAELKRPGMDAFLATCYAHYDLVAWSQTHWKWIEIKLTELGMLTNPNYKICCILDRSAMFRVERQAGKKDDIASMAGGSLVQNAGGGGGAGAKKRRRQKVVSHEVKPLAILWRSAAGQAAGWSEQNTVHIDDLARNFAMNPSCGLKCLKYYRKNDGAARDADELGKIGRFLVYLAGVADFRNVDFTRWRDHESTT